MAKLNRAQRNFKNQMSKAQKDIRKQRGGKYYSYIEDKHIQSYYDPVPSEKPKRIRKALYIVMYSILFVEILLTVVAASYAPKDNLPISVMGLTVIALTLFVFGLITPRAVFIGSRMAAAAIYGMTTFGLFVLLLVLATVY